MRKVKANREMRARYMTMQELLKDERKAGIQEGKQEAILTILRIKGRVSEALEEKIMSIEDRDMTSAFLIKAAQVQSIQQFEQELEKCQMQRE